MAFPVKKAQRKELCKKLEKRQRPLEIGPGEFQKPLLLDTRCPLNFGEGSIFLCWSVIRRVSVLSGTAGYKLRIRQCRV